MGFSVLGETLFCSLVACSWGWVCPVCAGLWQKGVGGDVWGAKLLLLWWSLEQCEMGSQAASCTELLSALLGLALGTWSWALSLCWIYSIPEGLPSAGSVTQGTVPFEPTGTSGAGHSFHFKHIPAKWEKSGAPHLAVFSHATILFQMKYDNTTVAVITVIDFREFKMIM